MLHLDAGVHFDEIKLAVFIQKLKCARTAVADFFDRRHAALANAFDQLARNARRWRFLNDLLVATLHGAISLTQPDRVLELVSHDLNFDVPRVLQEFLHVDLGVAERRSGLGLGGLHRMNQSRFGVDHPHAAPSTATCRFDDDRVANLLGRAFDNDWIVRQRTFRARHAGHTRLDHGLFGRHLVAHDADRLRGRADEFEAALLYTFGEVGVFAQKAVAGVNCLCIGYFCRRNDGGHVQVALCRRRGSDTDRLIGQLDVLGFAVGFGIHHHRPDTQFTAGALDPQGDLAAVGNQYFFKHPRYLGYSIMNSGWPYSTAWPFSLRILVTVPDLSASISLRIFMASMMQIVSPSLTALPTSTNDLAPGLDER